MLEPACESPSQQMTQSLISQNIGAYLVHNLNSYMNDRKELSTLLVYFLVKGNPAM